MPSAHSAGSSVPLLSTAGSTVPLLQSTAGSTVPLLQSTADAIVQGEWSTVSAFVIDTRSLRSISDAVNAIRAMSAVSKELRIMVQYTCEAAYTRHEVWKIVIPFAVEGWLTCCTDERTVHIWCSRCGKENMENDDSMKSFNFNGCSECDCVRAINVVSKQFEETVGDTYTVADEREMLRFHSGLENAMRG